MLRRPALTVIEEYKDEFRAHRRNHALTMPCPNFRLLGSEALQKLVISTEGEFLHALRYFALDTAAEVIRTIERRQFDEEDLNYVRYGITDPNTNKARWHMYTFNDRTVPKSTVCCSLPSTYMWLTNICFAAGG